MKHLLTGAAFAFALTSLVTIGSAHAAVADDPCTTVAKTDVAVALKSPVSSAKPQMASLSQMCTFSGTMLSTVTVTAWRGNDAADAQQLFTTATARMAKIYPPALPVTGIGDRALAIRSAIYVRKGTAVYVFDVLGRQGPEILARAAQLAKATMPHVKP